MGRCVSFLAKSPIPFADGGLSPRAPQSISSQETSETTSDGLDAWMCSLLEWPFSGLVCVQLTIGCLRGSKGLVHLQPWTSKYWIPKMVEVSSVSLENQLPNLATWGINSDFQTLFYIWSGGPKNTRAHLQENPWLAQTKRRRVQMAVATTAPPATRSGHIRSDPKIEASRQSQIRESETRLVRHLHFYSLGFWDCLTRNQKKSGISARQLD